MSNADTVKLSYKVESVYGTPPSGNYKELRLTSEDLHPNRAYIRSNELNSQRQITSGTPSDVNASGNINFEFSYGTYDDFLEAVLCASGWSTAVGISGTVYSASSVDNSINRSSGDFVAAGIAAGDWIKISGFATAGNNDVAKVVSVTTTKLVLSYVTLTTEAAGASVAIKKFGTISSGITQRSFTVAREYLDLTNQNARYPGCVFGGFSLEVALGAISKGAFTVLGAKEESLTTPPTTDAATTTEVLNAIENVAFIKEGGVVANGVLSFNLQLENNLRPRGRIGLLGAESIGLGKCIVSGSARVYYATKALADKLITNTPTNFAISFVDGLGNRYVIEIPSCKISTSDRSTKGGTNTDVVHEFGFEAFKDPTEGVSIKVSRLPYTV